MKLIIAIVQDEDASRLVSSLMNEGFGVTLLVGVADERFDGAMGVIEKVCKSRKQIATSPTSMAGVSGVYSPYPIEVMVGGATVFVLTVDQFVKL